MTVKPKFDSTITLGHILTIVSFLIGGTLAYGSLQTEIAKVRIEIEHMRVDSNKTELRLERLETRVRELEIRR